MSARSTLRACVLLAGILIATPSLRAADEKPTTRPQRPTASRDPGVLLKMQRDRLDQLSLTDDQKKKLDEIFAAATGDFRKALEETQNADPQERRQKMMPVMMAIREKIGAVLTDEQKQKLQQMGPMAGGRAPTTGRLKENLAKLDLSPDQKTKVDAILDESQKKADALRVEVENGNADRQKIMEKGQQIGDETRDELKKVLTAAQQEKLRGLMGASGPGPGLRNRPGTATRPAT